MAKKLKNIGEAVGEIEREKCQAASRSLVPFLKDAADCLARIPNKKRYERWTTAPWNQSMQQTVRRAILMDPDWRTFRSKKAQFSILLDDLVRGGLQFGYVATHDTIEENIEQLDGVTLIWPMTTNHLAEVRRSTIEGMTVREHASILWATFEKRIQIELRNACRREKSLNGALSALNETIRGATKSLLDSVQGLIGDAVCDGSRIALAEFENVRSYIDG